MTCISSFDRSWALHSSNLGIVCTFKGATHAVTSAECDQMEGKCYEAQSACQVEGCPVAIPPNVDAV